MKPKLTIVAVLLAAGLAGWSAKAFNNPHITELDLSIDGVPDNLEYFEPPSPSPATPSPPKGPGGFVCSNGWKKITLKATGINDPMKTRLNLCSDKIEIWTATNGGTKVSCPKLYDPASSMPTQLWVKGVKVSDYGPGKDASGNWTNCGPEHITLEAINNGDLPDIPGTYYDHIAFTVFTADYALDHVCTTAVHTATHDVLVTLKPSPLGTDIRLELKRASGASGAAIFVGGNSITNISETKTLTVLGTQASDPISNMLMEASLDSYVFTSDVFTVVDVVKETGTEVLHTRNTTNDTTQVDDTNTVWICQTSNNTATLELALDWKPTAYAGTEFRWDAILPDGTAASEWGTPGTFINNPTNITWTPGNPTNREFKIRTWFDCAAPSAYDATEPHRIIDVKVVDFVKLMLTNSLSGKKVDETRVDEVPSADNTLYLGETTNGTAEMQIQGWWLPEGVNSNWFRWKILLTNEANEADASTEQWLPGNNATFATNPVSVTWANKLDANGQTNRVFKVLGWHDCDHDDKWDSDEPHRLLYVDVVNIDLDANWPEVISSLGMAVEDAAENDSTNLFLAVNDDDDNGDEVVDNEGASASSVDADDDELAALIVRRIEISDLPGILTLEIPAEMSLFDASGNLVATPVTMDLSSPSGPLAGVLVGDVRFFVEANAESDDAVAALKWCPSSYGPTVTDEVHATLTTTEVTGGFTRGSVQYAAATMRKGRWYTGGALDADHPLSVLLPVPKKLIGVASTELKYALSAGGAAGIGTCLDAAYFQAIADAWNRILYWMYVIGGVIPPNPLGTLPPGWGYSGALIASLLSVETGVSVADLMAGKYFCTEAITTPGLYVFRFFASGDPTKFSSERLTVLKLDLVPDYNHDRVIDDTNDRGKVTASNPFRFWVNDDHDITAATGEDWPRNGGNADWTDDHVNDVRDLVDFFPVFIDLKDTLGLLGNTNYRYMLKHQSAAFKFFYTEDLKPATVSAYLLNQTVAESASMANATVQEISVAGVELPGSFLNKIKNDGKGIILVEAGAATVWPITLEIQDRSSGRTIATAKLSCKMSGVTDMFRYLNLRSVAGDNNGGASRAGEPPNNPDSLCNAKHVVFIHGFNEDANSGLGNICETFKRLYWSGSKAKYTGVTWFGNQQGSFPEPTYYHWNVTNAFITAAAFKNYVAGLPPETEVQIMAYSLGNMVVGSAIRDHNLANPSKYFLLHAAVAQEAYDAGAYNNAGDMVQSGWRPYPTWSYASEWHNLFPYGDGRSAPWLTWIDRFDDAVDANTFNFYSTGDNVLENLTGGGNFIETLIYDLGARHRWLWCVQELWKGRRPDYAGGSSYGGWGFNYADYGTDGAAPQWSVAQVNAQLTTNMIKTAPFFASVAPIGAISQGVLDTTDLYLEPNNPSGSGSVFALAHRAELLAEMIPALSFATGANPVSTLIDAGGDRNFNMQGQYTSGTGFQNGWPQDRLSSWSGNRWLHGDYNTVAYVYVYKCFDKISKELGGLNQ